MDEEILKLVIFAFQKFYFLADLINVNINTLFNGKVSVLNSVPATCNNTKQ